MGRPLVKNFRNNCPQEKTAAAVFPNSISMYLPLASRVATCKTACHCNLDCNVCFFSGQSITPEGKVLRPLTQTIFFCFVLLDHRRDTPRNGLSRGDKHQIDNMLVWSEEEVGIARRFRFQSEILRPLLEDNGQFLL